MHKYILEAYKGMKSRYTCPCCGFGGIFTRYIDTDTGEQLAAEVGKCDRINTCGYHLAPRQYFQKTGIKPSSITAPRMVKPSPPPPPYEVAHFINAWYVNKSFAGYAHNNFVQYLNARFGFDVADALLGKYRIGTGSYWPGATVFWQIDAAGKVRTGKVMLYNTQTGKRVKQPHNHITWAHTLLSNRYAANSKHFPFYGEGANARSLPATAHFKLSQCLFGEHLLPANTQMPVAVVESEKTAIIASAMMPAFIWLACGSLDGLNPEKCSVLSGRKVMLFPDVNGYEKWLAKARELQRAIPAARFEVSAILEQHATEENRKQGVDIADVVFG